MVNFIIGLFLGAIFGFLIACILASGKIADIIAERENPKHSERRIKER